MRRWVLLFGGLEGPVGEGVRRESVRIELRHNRAVIAASEFVATFN